MPPRGLPGNANLEQLKNGAKSFQRAVRAGDTGAAEVVREFHPRLGQAQPGSPELAAFKLADAQLVVARSFGFPSWARLKAYVELTPRYSRSPHAQPIGEPIRDEQGLVNEFLRLACLNYGEDDPGRWARARELLAANPELATATIHTIAAVGEVDAARKLLDRDSEAANRQGGPHDWEPLLYLTYSRLGATGPGRDALEAARVLVDHGADPNAGYLWEGLSPPFTVLTGAFGSGEGDPPPHADDLALARLLLEAGADPNDEQTLYNRHWDGDDRWLELLLEFGLGTGDGGRWRRLLAPVHASPPQLLDEQLTAAARAGFAGHVRLLLDHGADPEARGTRNHAYATRTPREEAMLRGYRECAELLRAAGATSGATLLYAFLQAATEGNRDLVQRLLADDPTLTDQAIALHPDQLVRAAQRNSVEAVALLIELGFDVNATNRLERYHESAPLHEAAAHGNLPMIELLLAHGADPNLRDPSYDSTPAGWAEHSARRKPSATSRPGRRERASGPAQHDNRAGAAGPCRVRRVWARVTRHGPGNPRPLSQYA
ncbi:MAG TPA: ankyrin repeat domain-containing protein [Solirubrobacteraceae bacterium]|nr:ankyrin repeat domain-containing protein [Solirubrobacteraceae bacterium]